MHDLPTDWLPRKTTFSLVFPVMVLADWFIYRIINFDNIKLYNIIIYFLPAVKYVLFKKW